MSESRVNVQVGKTSRSRVTEVLRWKGGVRAATWSFMYKYEQRFKEVVFIITDQNFISQVNSKILQSSSIQFVKKFR